MAGWKLGFPLALSTAVLWGLLPIALTLALTGTDPYTLTWFRFLTAALVLGGVLAYTRGLPRLDRLKGSAAVLLVVALGGLLGNFLLFLLGLKLTTPATSQIVTQLSPLFLVLGGVVIFGERLIPMRWFGFGLLIVGMLLFFNRRLPELAHWEGAYGAGVAILMLASLVWSCYGLAQKALSHRIGAQQILVLLYAGAAIVLLPFAQPSDLWKLNALQVGMVAFCCANTVLAYGALAEAMKRWEVTRVGAVLALTPLVTIASMWVFEHSWPGLIAPERLNATSVAGALLVVCGSAVAALASRPAR